MTDETIAETLGRPDSRDYDAFLYAPVGEDRNGFVVSVLSTLARLGLDPWAEASDLSAMPHEAARGRLGALLAGFRDVPTMVADHAVTSDRLSALLPRRWRQSTALSGTVSGQLATAAQKMPLGGVFALIIFALFIIRMMVSGVTGTGG